MLPKEMQRAYGGLTFMFLFAGKKQMQKKASENS